MTHAGGLGQGDRPGDPSIPTGEKIGGESRTSGTGVCTQWQARVLIFGLRGKVSQPMTTPTHKRNPQQPTATTHKRNPQQPTATTHKRNPQQPTATTHKRNPQTQPTATDSNNPQTQRQAKLHLSKKEGDGGKRQRRHKGNKRVAKAAATPERLVVVNVVRKV